MSTHKPLNKDVNPTKTIDARDLHSPIPLLRLKKALVLLNSKDILQIDCTDPGAGDDISSWCSRMKHNYLGEVRDFDYSSFFVEKK